MNEYHKSIQRVRDRTYGVAGTDFIKVYLNLIDLFGGIKEAMLFEKLLFWADKGADEEGWIYKSKEDVEEETKIKRSGQDRVRKNLEKLGVIEVVTKKPKGHNGPKLHYRINEESYQKLLAETDWKSRKPTKGKSRKPTNAPYTVDNSVDNTEEENPPLKVKRKKYGKQKNVKLTEEEFESLGRKLTTKFRDELIEEMSIYMVINRKSYADYNLAIQAWSKKEFKKDRLARAMEELNRQNPGQRQEETLTAEEKKLKAECRYCYHGHKAGVRIEHDCPRKN